MSTRLKNMAALLHADTLKVPGLARGTGIMFAARSPMERSVKIFLFSVGVVLPLGFLIWALLLWHGSATRKRVKGSELLQVREP